MLASLLDFFLGTDVMVRQLVVYNPCHQLGVRLLEILEMTLANPLRPRRVHSLHLPQWQSNVDKVRSLTKLLYGKKKAHNTTLHLIFKML